MKDIDSIFPRDMRVETRTDNFDRPCGYDVVGTRPGEPGVFPECVDRVCMMPDGMDTSMAKRAQIVAAIPEMLDRLGDHCQLCADCDWMNSPDPDCRFGRLWERIGGETD